jgi:hypothetical protein
VPGRVGDGGQSQVDQPLALDRAARDVGEDATLDGLGVDREGRLNPLRVLGLVVHVEDSVGELDRAHDGAVQLHVSAIGPSGRQELLENWRLAAENGSVKLPLQVAAAELDIPEVRVVEKAMD